MELVYVFVSVNVYVENNIINKDFLLRRMKFYYW